MVFNGVVAGKVAGQQLHVAAALTQWRQRNFYGVDAVNQVFAEQVLGSQLVNRHVGSRNEADIHWYRRIGAERNDLPVLQHGKQLGLHGRRNIANLIQKQSASRSGFKTAGPIFFGIRKSTFFVAENLTFKKRFGEGRNVYTYKGFAGTKGLLVQRAGYQFLACAVLPKYKHVGFGRGNLFNFMQHFLYCFRLAKYSCRVAGFGSNARGLGASLFLLPVLQRVLQCFQ